MKACSSAVSAGAFAEEKEGAARGEGAGGDEAVVGGGVVEGVEIGGEGSLVAPVGRGAGDAVEARNTHAAIYDALRLVHVL